MWLIIHAGVTVKPCQWKGPQISYRMSQRLCTLLAFCCALLRISWWRHQMETFSALLALCVAGEFPAQRPGRWSFDQLMFSLICASINGWVHNREAGDLRRHRAHYDVTVMFWYWSIKPISFTRLSQFKWTPWWKCVNELCKSNVNNYLKQYWLIIGKVPWHSSEVHFSTETPAINQWK